MTLVACIGGGQLGRMLALAGIPLGLPLPLPRPESRPRAPAEVGELLVGPYDDRRSARPARSTAPMSSRSSSRTSRSRQRRRAQTVPGRRALEEGQDRLREKELFRRLGVPTARFGTLEEIGLPALVKSAATRLRREGAAARARCRRSRPRTSWPRSSSRSSASSPSSRVRGRDGDTRFWPVAENVHRDGILRVSRVPADGSASRRTRRRSPSPCSTSSTTSACSRSSCSRSVVACSRTSSRRACTTRATGRSTAPRRASSRTTCGRSLGLPLGSTAARAVGHDGQPDRRVSQRSSDCLRSPGRTSTSTARSRGRVASSGT